MPHVIEPTLPGAVEHYLNLGDCYRREGLAPLRGEIAALSAEYKACYPRAYRCLSAAADIAGDCRSLLDSDGLREKIARRAKGVVTRQLRQPGTGSGTLTPRFLGALTCRGAVHLWETVEAQCPQVIELEDSYGFAHLFLTPLARAAAAAGQDGILCPDPMEPDRPAHLLLPGLGLAFVSSRPDCPYPGKVHRRIRLDAMVETDILRRLRPRLRFGRKVAAAITQEAVASLAQAKALHDRLEALYNPHVDFQRVNALAEDLCQQLGI